MPLGTTGYTLDGTDLRTYAFNIEEVGEQWPGVRADERVYAYRHGAVYDGRYFYRPRMLTLAMVVLPQDSSGAVTTSGPQHLEDNMDALQGLFHRKTGYSTLSKTRADGAVRTLEVRVLEPIRFQKNPQSGVTRGAVTLRTGYPFWHGTSNSHAGLTGSTAVTNSGNAPVNDMVVTFNTAGRVTVDGSWIESSVNGLVVDVGARTAKVGSTDRDDALSVSDAWWLEFQPGSNTVVPSGGANVDVDFFDGWF